mgnify:CR=1 FL=1
MIKRQLDQKTTPSKTGCLSFPNINKVRSFADSTRIGVTFFDSVEEIDLTSLNQCADEVIAKDKTAFEVCKSNTFPDTWNQCEKARFFKFPQYIRACYMVENNYRSATNKYKKSSNPPTQIQSDSEDKKIKTGDGIR